VICGLGRFVINTSACVEFSRGTMFTLASAGTMSAWRIGHTSSHAYDSGRVPKRCVDSERFNASSESGQSVPEGIAMLNGESGS